MSSDDKSLNIIVEDDIITGDIVSQYNVVHCKVSFSPVGKDILCSVHSPIIDKLQGKNIGRQFLNGLLDNRIEKAIVKDIIDFTGLEEKLIILMCLHQISDVVRKQPWYVSNNEIDRMWGGYRVPEGYAIADGCVNMEKLRQDMNERYYVPFCRVPCMTTATGRNIDNDEYWVRLKFMNIYNVTHEEWVSQQDSLSRRGIMKLADRGINLIEKNASTMNDYLGACLKTNAVELPRMLVTEKNGWKCDNTIFACGKRGFSNGKILEIIPLKKEAYDGLRVSGELGDWINAVKPIIHLPMIRMKMYAVFTAPLLRLLNVQSFILDHNGESSIGKTFSNDLAMSMIGDADTLRFNGDTTKTAAEILAEMYTDLPLYLDETGTQQTEDVLKAIIYMLSNEQGRMRGHKDGGLRETGKWKTVALTTGERPLTSHKSFSGQQVRVIEIRGGLSKDVIDDVKVAADTMKESYGHFVEPFFLKLDEYKNNVSEMYQMSRKRYLSTDSVKVNRMASSFAAMLTAGIIVEDMLCDAGIDPIEPHEIVDQFFIKCVLEDPIENYSIRALQTVMDWVHSKNMCFVDDDNPSETRTYDFYGWIDKDHIDVIPSELRKMLDRSGFDSVRTRNDWIDDGIVVVNSGRKDLDTRHNGKKVKVVRFVREEVNNALFN
jgi:uncharacterized protein (DUF927 family)